MKTLREVVLVCLISLFLAPMVAHGQSLTITITTSFDASTGQAYEYADTSSDYATGYYYDLCTYPDAFGEEDNGTWDFYETSGSCGSTDSAVSWYFMTDGTTDFVQFDAESDEYIDYYVYQMDGDCDFDGYNCEAYWDAFEMSLLAGDNAGGGAYYTLGPPAIAYLLAQIEQTAVAYQGTECVYPTGESSTYYLEESSGTTGFYGAGFKMALTGSGSFYPGRQVREFISGVQLSNPNDPSTPACWYSGSAATDPRSAGYFGTPSTWDVHSGNTYGDQGASDADFIGLAVSAGNTYQTALGGTGKCVAYYDKQSMTMSSCTDGTFDQLHPYDPGHANWFTVLASGMQGTRQSVGGTAQ